MFPAYLLALFTLSQELEQPLLPPVDARAMFLSEPFHAWLRRAEFLLGYGEVRRMLSLQKAMMEAMERSEQGGYWESYNLRREHRRVVKKIEEQHPTALGDAA